MKSTLLKSSSSKHLYQYVDAEWSYEDFCKLSSHWLIMMSIIFYNRTKLLFFHSPIKYYVLNGFKDDIMKNVYYVMNFDFFRDFLFTFTSQESKISCCFIGFKRFKNKYWILNINNKTIQQPLLTLFSLGSF